ncbi:MAG: HEPN domain-containing protein [Pseudomonadota bacterium]|nr:HEPN domain-containing protein [Pseudomonadota bacterium]
MINLDDWGWALHPATEPEFEAMMASLDVHLASCGVLPHQRAFAAQSLVAKTLGMTFSIPPPPRRSSRAFHADDTINWVSDWFKAVYGKRLNPHFEARSLAVDIRGTLWRMRLPIIYGTMQWFFDPDLDNKGISLAVRAPATGNALTLIEDFTPAMAQRLTHDEIKEIGASLLLGYEGVEALDFFKEHVLFDQARLDYAHSVDALVSGIAWNKARWETAQAAEKIIKGLLKLAGKNFPTQGRDAHNITHLGGLAADHLGVAIPKSVLEAIDCKPAVRYGEEEATRALALAAHQAFLELLPVLVKANHS